MATSSPCIHSRGLLPTLKRSSVNSIRQRCWRGLSPLNSRVGTAPSLVAIGCSCPLWVNNGHRGYLKECPLYPRKQTARLAVPRVHQRADYRRSTERAGHPDAAWWGVASDVSRSAVVAFASLTV